LTSIKALEQRLDSDQRRARRDVQDDPHSVQGDEAVTSTEIRDELLALKADAARLLGAAGDEMLNASRERADALTEQLKSALDELGRALTQEEKQIEGLVAERPIAALACAFAVGLAVGLALRR
jgi:ElaB/YqjD/DUF883 family membrane-anchored ribosome-binding protein